MASPFFSDRIFEGQSPLAICGFWGFFGGGLKRETGHSSSNRQLTGIIPLLPFLFFQVPSFVFLPHGSPFVYFANFIRVNMAAVDVCSISGGFIGLFPLYIDLLLSFSYPLNLDGPH